MLLKILATRADMSKKLSYRKAKREDVPHIIQLLIEDDLGKNREFTDDAAYLNAFELIDKDPNQYLSVVEMDGVVVGTCHLTIMPSLTFKGRTRMQIEGVRVSEKLRGQAIGEWMIKEAVEYGRSKGATIIQLMTNKQRIKAKKFYEKVGFEATHEGMKMFL